MKTQIISNNPFLLENRFVETNHSEAPLALPAFASPRASLRRQKAEVNLQKNIRQLQEVSENLSPDEEARFRKQIETLVKDNPARLNLSAQHLTDEHMILLCDLIPEK